MRYKFAIVIRQDEDGNYIAEVPSLPGCHTYGSSFEEVQNNVEEVIEMHLERAEEQNNGPVEISTPEISYIEVQSPLYA